MSKVSIEAICSVLIEKFFLAINKCHFLIRKKICVHEFVPIRDFSFLVGLCEKLHGNFGHCGKNEHINTLWTSVWFRAVRMKITWDDSVEFFIRTTIMNM